MTQKKIDSKERVASGSYCASWWDIGLEATWRTNNHENNDKSSHWILHGSFLEKRPQIHLQDDKVIYLVKTQHIHSL
jgi:hypothetical protein